MKEKTGFWFLFLVSQLTFSQIRGVVVDEKNQPIPFVSIWVEHENTGTSTEENGSFEIEVKDRNNNLIFLALGFEKQTINATQVEKVVLKTTTFELNEVLVDNRLDTKTKEIGTPKSEMYQAFENGPRIDIKYFPYSSVYSKTKYIKKIALYCDSRLDDVSIKIHLYKTNDEGLPGEEMTNKDLIFKLKNGIHNNLFDVTSSRLMLPKKGIYVGFEKLIIEKNKIEKKTKDLNNSEIIKKTYLPYVLYHLEERPFSLTFSNGKWVKKSTSNTSRTMVYEPAIKLILSN
jgi:hypothetical protein